MSISDRRPSGADRIVFIHQNKAAYPEIAAYKKYFSGSYASIELGAAELATDAESERAVYWVMMGFYPSPLHARLVVHDYRSLSVGFARRLKDRVKAFGNHKPDLRIYQNDEIRQALCFRDGTPELMIPMGVPDDIARYRNTSATGRNGDFCYIGSMLPERKVDTMIDSFLRRYAASKTLHLFGVASRPLRERYRGHVNITFAGTLRQEELFARLRGFDACVCYFPNHYPHVLQTPTKLLEYAALGLRIICNEQAQSRKAEKRYGIACLWGPADDMFAGAPDRITWSDNATLDPASMLWTSVIRQSGIDSMLDRLSGTRFHGHRDKVFLELEDEDGTTQVCSASPTSPS